MCLLKDHLKRMNTATDSIHYRELTAADEAAVIVLANQVHGANYLTEVSFADYLDRGQQDGVNLNWLAFAGEQLVGVRLTFAPGRWDIDSYCTPAAWPVPASQMCYFKCAAVDDSIRGAGIGRNLLQRSIAAAQQLGCRAGLAHIWMQSPANSAFAYFSRCGGKLIKEHPGRWHEASVHDGYHCLVCDGICYCTAGEMILPFDNY